MFGVRGGWQEVKRSIESKAKLHFGEHVFPNVKHDTLILLYNTYLRKKMEGSY